MIAALGRRQPAVEVADRHRVAGPQDRAVGQRRRRGRRTARPRTARRARRATRPSRRSAARSASRASRASRTRAGRSPEAHRQRRAPSPPASAWTNVAGMQRRLAPATVRRRSRRAPGRTRSSSSSDRLGRRHRPGPDDEVRAMGVDPRPGPDELVGAADHARPVVRPGRGARTAGRRGSGSRSPRASAGERRGQRRVVVRARDDQARAASGRAAPQGPSTSRLVQRRSDPRRPT